MTVTMSKDTMIAITQKNQNVNGSYLSYNYSWLLWYIIVISLFPAVRLEKSHSRVFKKDETVAYTKHLEILIKMFQI